MVKNVLSFDFGASNGKPIVSKFDGVKLESHEIHKFKNDPITIDDTLCWDIDNLFKDTIEGIKKAIEGYRIDSICIDTWGADFGLIDR